MNQLELMEGHLRDPEEESVTVINTTGNKAVNMDGGGVGVGEGRSQLKFRRWKYADRVMFLIWD